MAKEPAWYKTHDLAVMRQVLAKLQEADPLISSAGAALDDMPPIIIRSHRDSSVSGLIDAAHTQILRATRALEEAIRDR